MLPRGGVCEGDIPRPCCGGEKGAMGGVALSARGRSHAGWRRSVCVCVYEVGCGFVGLGSEGRYSCFIAVSHIIACIVPAHTRRRHAQTRRTHTTTTTHTHTPQNTPHFTHTPDTPSWRSGVCDRRHQRAFRPRPGELSERPRVAYPSPCPPYPALAPPILVPMPLPSCRLP